MHLKHGFGRAAAVAVLLVGTAPLALFAETPADTLGVADAIDDIVSIDPGEACEFSGVDLNNNTYDSLIELDAAKPGELVPGLAESWAVSDDGKTYTFKIKSGITFSSACSLVCPCPLAGRAGGTSFGTGSAGRVMDATRLCTR